MDQETEVQETQESSTTSTIDNLDDALKEVAKLRRENAARRTKANEVEEAAQKWKEHVDKSKSDLERLTGQTTEEKRRADAAQEEADRLRVMLKFQLPEEFEVLLSGSVEQMEKAAKLLQGKTGSTSTAAATDYFAGRRGTAVTGEPAPDENTLFAQWWNANSK